MAKIGRNERCPCGSGKKFKHCHGHFSQQPTIDAKAIENARQMMMARERVRQTQQGLGKPVISANVAGHQVVAIGNQLLTSNKWKTFPDFLMDYLKTKLGKEWIQEQIGKPLAERHQLLQWGDALHRLQAKVITQGVPSSYAITGVVACYFGVAYGLYLLDHNVELQERLIKRLKDPGNFQGAYYELIVARALILAGFKLTLEDETNRLSKHCEFAAIAPESGKRYWVEAKMRAVMGLLGRTAKDGTSNTNPISSLIPQLNAALAKPAADERMIFIDLNAEMAAEVDDENRPAFIAAATNRLVRYEEKELQTGQSAYVFITNANFHRELDGPARCVAFPFGLGIPEFNRPGHYRLSDWHENERKHLDAIKAADGLGKLLNFPVTFDGAMPSVALGGERPPVVIGQTYNFEGAGENGENIIGTVSDAIVMESEMSVTVAVNCSDGKGRLLKELISETQLRDYKAYPDAYFGKVVRPQKMAKTPHDLFLFFMDAYRELSREDLIGRLQGGVPGAEAMDDERLRAIYCEGLVSTSKMFMEKDGITTAEPATHLRKQA